MTKARAAEHPPRVSPHKTLEVKYPVRYSHPQRTPVQLLIKGNTLRIRFFVRYSKRMLASYPGTDLSFADIAEMGIRANWSGRYHFPWLSDDGYELAHYKAKLRTLEKEAKPTATLIDPDDVPAPAVRVTVEFIRYGSLAADDFSKKQRYVKIHLSRLSFVPSHVRSPVWRWYWGLVPARALEASHLNWRVEHPGKMYLQKNPRRTTFQKSCAHEAGHILGLGDAYGAYYRYYYEAPGTSSYMMCHNRAVDPKEIEMVLLAHTMNKMHYFPCHFRAKTFFRGLFRSFRIAF